MGLILGQHALPGGRAYVWANRVSWCAGLFAAFTVFSLIPPWYVGLPLGLVAIWVTTALSGIVWYQVRELLSCTERLHRIQSGLILAIAIPIGLIALIIIPNWKDFEYNGHPSLLAVAGSILMGLVAFVYGAGIVSLLGTLIFFIFKSLRRNKGT